MTEADSFSGGAARPDHRDGALNRRQLLKAGAWAAPAILLATAAPAQAAVSGPIVPEDTVRLTANCATTTGRETNHGFTLSNGKLDEVTVIVTFTATASGVLRLTAIANLISITSTPDAQYPVTPDPDYVLDGKTYQTMWESVTGIHVEATASRYSASRDGTATFVLPPGASVTIGQINTNVVGEGRVTGRIQSINGEVENLSSMALFAFELGGACFPS